MAALAGGEVAKFSPIMLTEDSKITKFRWGIFIEIDAD
jgi:hypothetical protein